MNTVNPNAGEAREVIPLDYGHAAGRAAGLKAEIAARVDGLLHFMGMLLGIFGGARQLVWSIGFALVAGGLGQSLEARGGGNGSLWLFIGAFLIGAIIPAPKARRE